MSGPICVFIIEEKCIVLYIELILDAIVLTDQQIISCNEGLYNFLQQNCSWEMGIILYVIFSENRYLKIVLSYTPEDAIV